MKRMISWCIRQVKWLGAEVTRKPGDWMATVRTGLEKGFAAWKPLTDAYDPDAEFEDLSRRQVESPVYQFQRDVAAGTTRVAEAYLWEGRLDERGKLIPQKTLESVGLHLPYRTRRVVGNEAVKSAFNEAEAAFKSLPERWARAKEAKRAFLQKMDRLHAAGLVRESSFIDGFTTQYDTNQYTEYTPAYGGPFNKQLYLYDYLTMHARAFEARNHNPIAKRIVDVLAQYAFGRRFKVRIQDAKKKKLWEDYEAKYNLIHRLSEFWVKEYLTYGELMVNKANMQSIDPSTVWDIITDPDDITNVYYYYQSYSTAFQTFTGYKVPGAPGSKDASPLEYIVRQIPARQVIHIKGNVVSQEKRGRSILFPVLGWLKRIKDLYNAEVIRAQLQASFIWDDMVKGTDAEVQAHASKYSSMPVAASVFVHNENVERKPMAALPEGQRAGAGVGDEILAFIATAVGIPKDFFNIMASGGGNRATALVGSEPFEKVVEDLQAKFENLLLNIAEELFESSGAGYKKGDIEFVFPSVTKDTTTETIKNIGTGETLGYIDHEMAAEMFAAEMNITSYDYDDVQKKVDDYKKDHPTPGALPPDGRFGGDPLDAGTVPDDANPTKGQAKVNLKKQMNRV